MVGGLSVSAPLLLVLVLPAPLARGGATAPVPRAPHVALQSGSPATDTLG